MPLMIFAVSSMAFFMARREYPTERGADAMFAERLLSWYRARHVAVLSVIPFSATIEA